MSSFSRSYLFVRGTVFALSLLAFGSFCSDFVHAQNSPEQILAVLPSQEGIPADSPSDSDIAQCKLIEFSEGNHQGICLTRPDGVTPLRVWCATKGSRTVEQVRFYRNGIEIFRDILTKDRGCRWLGDLGSRSARLDSDKQILSWQSISPEETTAEIVAALVNGDLERFKRVALTEDDLKTLGLEDPLYSEVLERIKSIDSRFQAFATNLNLPASMQWGAFNGNRPALLPEGAKGLTRDLPIYFNSSVILMNRDKNAQSRTLTIGDLVQIGKVWKIVGLPSSDAATKPASENMVSSVFFSGFSEGGDGGAATSGNYNKLAEQLNEAYHRLESVSPEEYPTEIDKTCSILITLAQGNPKEKNELIKQAADLVFTAIQRGLYPQGPAKLKELLDRCKDVSDQELIAHLKLRQIDGEYFIKTQKNPPPKRSELEKAQDEHTEQLSSFVDTYAKTNAGALTLMYLAQDLEYLQEDDQAIGRYEAVVKNFPDATIGQKAAGAIKRLESVGKSLELSAWNFLEGGTLNLSDYRGKSLIIFCWASWTTSEVEQLQALLEKQSNVQAVGFNFDTTKEQATAFIQTLKKPLPWKNVYDAGGFESKAAIELGIQNVPLFILINSEGKVVRANISTFSELEVLLEK